MNRPQFDLTPQQPSVATAVGTWAHDDSDMSAMNAILLSLLAHLTIAGSLALIIMIMQFFGWKIPLLDPLAIKQRDIEFVLVNNPPAKPRASTQNRAKHSTRSGGKKVSQKQAEAEKAAGQPKPTQKPQPKAAQRPQPKPRPVQAQRPVPQPRPVTKVTPAPQAPPTPVAKTIPKPQPPKLPTRVIAKALPNAPVLPPNPIAPAIKTPAAPTPKGISGPVAFTPTTGGRGTSGTSLGPSQIPGKVSGSPGGGGSPRGGATGGRPGSAGSSGSGGRGAFNTSGSPGGGGGRPGIDAMADPDFGAYMDELKRRIRRNWRPPQAQEDKRVVVMFRIGRDGRLTGTVHINKSSGFVEADKAAIDAVKLSSPFRPLPAEYRGEDIPVEFTFDYSVMNGSRNVSGGRR